jgi:hypothetical protein
MRIYHSTPGEFLPPDAKTSSFFAWASSLGIRISPKLSYPVRFPPGYLGFRALSLISPCEDLLWAPNSAMLTTKLMSIPQLEPIFAAHPSLFAPPDRAHEDNRMLVFLLFEQSKGEASMWQPYFSFLPQDVETIIDWNDDQLDELQDKEFEFDSKFRRERDFKGNTELGNVLRAYGEMFREELLGVENINWLWKILCTRSYGPCIPYSGLIPVADLFNHGNVSTNYFYAPPEESCPDSSNDSVVIDYEDTDDPLVESKKPLVLACMKLIRLSLPGYKSFTGEKSEKYNEILQQARAEDSQSFLKSIL